MVIFRYMIDKIKEFVQNFSEFSGRRKALIILLVVLLVVIVVLMGILVKTAQNKDKPKPTLEVVEGTRRSSTEESTEATEAMTKEVDYPYQNPFTGGGLTNEEHEALVQRRPLLVSYDNLNDAWPQSGVSHADFYIEVLAEGRITRFLCLYYADAPELIGPIRSARPYIVTKAVEHDAYLAHVGGSMQALADIQNYGIADLDGLWSGAFNRIPPKVAPHNTYATYDDLMAEAENLGYRMTSEPVFYSFGKEARLKEADDATDVQFSYREAGLYDNVGYTSSYRYDSKTGQYTRHLNGEVQKDEQDEGTIEVANILVQYASHQVLDDEGRLAIDLYSGGNAYLFRDGKVLPLQWKKDEMSNLTTFYYDDGSEVVLAKGKTALHIVYEGILNYE